jgi:hypothetical protein
MSRWKSQALPEYTQVHGFACLLIGSSSSRTGAQLLYDMQEEQRAGGSKQEAF